VKKKGHQELSPGDHCFDYQSVSINRKLFFFLQVVTCRNKKLTYNRFQERIIKMSIKAKLACLCLTYLLFLAWGCVKTPMLYHGNTVTSAPVVALMEGGPTMGEWKTSDVTIDYKYIKKGDDFEISGQAALSQSNQMSYSNISKMYSYIFFLDKNSRVIETAYFVDEWTDNTQDNQNFSKSYKVPTGTTGFSFGYSGELKDMNSAESIYELPLK
jgi:hypothetical protein